MPIEIVIEMPECTGCCGTPICGTMECRVRSGASSATLCGFSEYASPSSPPKKYKVKTFSGSTPTLYYTGHNTCDVPSNCGWTDTFSGSITYDPSSSCTVPTGTGVQTRSGSCGNDGTDNVTTINVYVAGTGYTYVSAQTTYTQVADNTCHTVPSTSDGIKRTSTSVVETLSSEDTIDDAISRAGYGSWGSWGACDTTKYSSISTRGAGVFTSTFQEGEARVCCSNLTIGHDYRATLATEMRTTGSSGSWSVGPSVVLDFTASSTSECSEIEIPLVDQMEVRATGINVEKM